MYIYKKRLTFFLIKIVIIINFISRKTHIRSSSFSDVSAPKKRIYYLDSVYQICNSGW